MSVHEQQLAAVDSTWQPDWDALAEQIVDRTLRIASGERVVYLADPRACPELLDAVRARILRMRAIEQATILGWTPRLAALRTPSGQAPEAATRQQERYAHRDLLHTADVFIWLPSEFFQPASYTAGESEWVLDSWRGRGLHFHWFPDAGHRPDHPIHRQVQRIYERAILDLDYAALGRRQRRLVEALRGRTVRVTTPEGTDLSFELPADAWFHCNDGDGSRDKSLRAVCARDREEELPCGAVRSVPAPDSTRGIVALRRKPAWNGAGFDIAQFASYLDIVFRDGRIVELRGGSQQAELDALRATFTGDWDRLGEVVLGTNPLLTTPPEAHMPTYWGFGEGWLRLHLGDNLESGGRFQSEVWTNLFLGTATVTADNAVIVRDGTLLVD
jgi:leucyl aminopeptidase (aminopeptidase T)